MTALRGSTFGSAHHEKPTWQESEAVDTQVCRYGIEKSYSKTNAQAESLCYTGWRLLNRIKL